MPRRWGRGRRARIGTDAATSGGIDKDSATDTATEDRVEAGPVETDAPIARLPTTNPTPVSPRPAAVTRNRMQTPRPKTPPTCPTRMAHLPATGRQEARHRGRCGGRFVRRLRGFRGATVQPYLADRATVATKLKIARTAADAITTLWTYTPDNMDTLADRAANYLSGDFEAQYRKFVDGIAPANKQAKVTNNTQVTGVAVESLAGPEAIAIVYTNTTSTSPLTKGIPSLKYLSYRLFMKRAHGRWLVNRMTTITSLDLTPRL
ncbi:putative conserved Mce associated membrane protein [Mycobacterium xenopi 3993]|nr:putative conserved Mce associated membrane protein [Mycobacterium xenopi 3993]